MTLLATVDQLAARLGATLTEGTPDYIRATSAIEDVSERAMSIAEQPTWDADTVPKSAVGVILAAARRVYVNPDRYQYNMAGQFTAQGAADQFIGGYFMAEELSELKKFIPKPGLWVLSTYRDRDCSRYHVGQFYSDGQGGDPILLDDEDKAAGGVL